MNPWLRTALAIAVIVAEAVAENDKGGR